MKSQLQDWECDFCFFPMWPRRSREKESWTTQTTRYLCVLSLASCVSGAFWAEWNRERLKYCFICCYICMDWWYISYCLSHHYGKLPDCGKGHGGGSLSMVWLVFILMNQEVKRASATLCPSKSHSQWLICTSHSSHFRGSTSPKTVP